MTTVEEFTDQARKNLKKYEGYNSTWSVHTIGDASLNYEAKRICYAGLSSTNSKKFDVFGIGYYCNPDQEAGQNYLKFITSPDESPWRYYIKDEFEIVKDDDDITHGILIGKKTLDAFSSNDGKVFKNFMIGSRTWNEFRDQVVFWDEAVKQGIDKYKALVMSESFQIYDGKITHNINHSWNHWAFACDIDINKMIEGHPTSNTGGINASFGKPGQNFGCYQAVQKRYSKATPDTKRPSWDYIKKIEATYLEV